ncbi:MAG: BadF/BadG/BcrA/BcrD ATPase family protein, partial [Burkholderiales bacterium]
AAGRDRIFFTGSGAGFLAPLVGAKLIQEVVAVAAAVEKLHPDVRFVSEIGGEDMKTVFFTPSGEGSSKQVFMQSACSGGTGTFIEKTARKLAIPTESLAQMAYAGMSLHKVSSKCGIFAEADANTLVKSGVPVEEIIASLYEAVVYQNLATLTKGNTPVPEVLLLGGPNMFFTGLQQAWRHHLAKLWKERRIDLPEGKKIEDVVLIPADALYYACLGCIEIGQGETNGVAVYQGVEKLRWWIDVGQHEQKAKEGSRGLIAGEDDYRTFCEQYADTRKNGHAHPRVNGTQVAAAVPIDAGVFLGCDFGSTTAKAVLLSPEREVLFTCYAISKGNPIEDTMEVFAKLEKQVTDQGASLKILGVGTTGYAKDILKDVVGADAALVETVAHTEAALKFYPHADVICDVGGQDIKIIILRNGRVKDFKL